MHEIEKLSTIKRNLKEIVGDTILEQILKKREVSIYWGTATTGKPHIAYFLPILKIKDFVDAGCNVIILLADVHAFLDNLKAPIEKIEARSKYYKKIILLMLKSINVDTSKIEFVLGSTYQKSNEYFTDIMRILSLTKQNDAKRAGSEVVKQVSNSKLSSLVYPAMQALDEEYLKVDIQFGGVDQRKIFMYAREFLPLIKYKKRIHLMNPMISGLNADKMSSSDRNSKIDLLDSEEVIRKKIDNVDLSNNGFLELFKYIIYPYCCIHGLDVSILDRSYNYDELVYAFTNKEVTEEQLKNAGASIINLIISPIREQMLTDMEVINNAYD